MSSTFEGYAERLEAQRLVETGKVSDDDLVSGRARDRRGRGPGRGSRLRAHAVLSRPGASRRRRHRQGGAVGQGRDRQRVGLTQGPPPVRGRLGASPLRRHPYREQECPRQRAASRRRWQRGRCRHRVQRVAICDCELRQRGVGRRRDGPGRGPAPRRVRAYLGQRRGGGPHHRAGRAGGALRAGARRAWRPRPPRHAGRHRGRVGAVLVPGNRDPGHHRRRPNPGLGDGRRPWSSTTTVRRPGSTGCSCRSAGARWPPRW